MSQENNEQIIAENIGRNERAQNLQNNELNLIHSDIINNMMGEGQNQIEDL